MDATKAVALKQEAGKRSKICNLSSHKKLVPTQKKRKEQKTKWKEVIKITAYKNDTVNKKIKSFLSQISRVVFRLTKLILC